MDNVCCLMLQEGIPCLRRAKRTTRVISTENMQHHELVACVNIMHGTLLMLYNMGAKRPIFTARVAILRRLRALMDMKSDAIAAFIQENTSLVKICFMEYALNFLVDYMPVEKVTAAPCAVTSLLNI